MAKRSDFERRERDFYATPMEAMLPLLPHLPERFEWFEPCAGDGAIIRHMKVFRPTARLIGATDLEPLDDGIEQCDLLERMPMDLYKADLAITNLPWDRKVLHPLIVNITQRTPLWTLLDSNWANTAQAVPYLEICSKIVQVGRLKWIPGSKDVGKDDCAWFLFDAQHVGATRFYGRMSRADKAFAKQRFVVD
jgi:hypothetical protein